MESRGMSVIPNPAVMWLTVTSANAQKPQKTKACARPAAGRSKMTLPCSNTSQMKRPTRGAIGWRLQVVSGFAARMMRTTLLNRTQNRDTDVQISAARIDISASDGRIVL